MSAPHRRSSVAAVAVAFVVFASTAMRPSQSFCPTACQCNDVELAAWCPHAQLGIVPITLNPGIKVLDLENNRIRDLTNALQFYTELESLNLSKNHISDLRSLHFEAQTQLRHLRLANNEIDSLHEDSFVGLASLRTLDLGHNRLRRLGPRVFSSLASLEVLTLEGNEIASVDRTAMRGPVSQRLAGLNLRDNALTSVCGVFGGALPSLRDLDVGSNPIRFRRSAAAAAGASPIDDDVEDADDDEFAACFSNWAPNVESLAFSDVASADGGVGAALPGRMFAGLPRLRVLRLEGDGLADVCGYDWDLPNVAELYLGGNAVRSLEAGCFRGLPKLQILEASWNSQLTTIRGNAFSFNPELQIAVFDHNVRLALVEPSAFDGIAALRQLSFRHCDDLRSLPQIEAFGTKTLNLFELTGNSFECNCSLSWYFDILSASPKETAAVVKNGSTPVAVELLTSEQQLRHPSAAPYFSDVTCSPSVGPPATRGRRLSSLTASRDALGCSELDAWHLAAVAAVAAVIFLVATSAAVALAVLRRCRSSSKRGCGGGGGGNDVLAVNVNGKPGSRDVVLSAAASAVGNGRLNHVVAPMTGKDDRPPTIFFLAADGGSAPPFDSAFARRPSDLRLNGGGGLLLRHHAPTHGGCHAPSHPAASLTTSFRNNNVPPQNLNNYDVNRDFHQHRDPRDPPRLSDEVNHYQQLVYSTRMLMMDKNGRTRRNGGRNSTDVSIKKNRSGRSNNNNNNKQREGSSVSNGNNAEHDVGDPLLERTATSASTNDILRETAASSSSKVGAVSGENLSGGGSGLANGGSKTWHNKSSPWTIFGGKEEEYIYRTPDGSNAIIPVTEL